MALNFPPNPSDQATYIDPSSGLKYIFNLAIGGWETALQPPVIITDGTTPDINLEGFLWYDNANQILKVYRNGAWVPVTQSNNASPVSVTISKNEPLTPSEGDLWWDTVSGQLYIYYIDADSQQWVIASPASTAGGGGSSNVYVGNAPPSNPKKGDMYFNDASDVLFVYDGSTWVPATAAPASGVNSLTVEDPIRNKGSNVNPAIAIFDAAIDQKGAIRLATQSEVDLPDLNTTQALTPSRLKLGIDYYLPQATEIRKGVVELATVAEVGAGTDAEKAITPATLAAANAAAGNPTGTVITFAGETAPEGYVACNGATIAAGDNNVKDGKVVTDPTGATVVDMTALVAIIGTQLPDLRGEFVRGWTDGRVGVDDGRVIRSFQGASVEAHTHEHDTGLSADDFSPGLQGGANRVSSTGTSDTSSYGGSETRPRNIALLYCIKY